MGVLHLAVETAATQTKPAYAGYKSLYFRLGLESKSHLVVVEALEARQ
jgi:hypothetical protein